MGIIWVSEPGA